MKSNKNKMSNKKLLLINNDNSIPKRGPDSNLGNMASSDYSTIFTNSNIYNTKYSNIDRLSTPISSTKKMETFNTIDENTRDILYLSKVNIEYDIYLSSLKKQLILMRERRKKTENVVTNLKRKIIELQKEEENSIKQLENTKKYIRNIINNRIKNKNKTNRKSFDIKISTKKNNISSKTYNNKSPNYKLYHNSDINLNTWVDTRKKPIIKNQKLGHFNCYSGIYNRDNLLNKKNKYKETLNYNFINFNTVNPTIYNKKKVKFNSNKKYNKDNKNNIKLRESLVQQLKKDEEEQMKIKNQLEEIEKEQNSLFNNFYEDIAIYESSKTFNLDENTIKYNI